MTTTYFEIIDRMNKLNLLHRMSIQTEGYKNGLYLGQLPILEYVRKNSRCTQRELANFLGVSPPSIATSVKRMQKAGLIEKETDETDQRYSRLSITEKGILVSEKCRAQYDCIDAQLFAGFDEKECETLYKFFGRMIANLCADAEDISFMTLIEEAQKLSAKQIKEEDKVD
ncbi:MAG: winged helix-turn-helix transcriptional regulator [Clostridia bacterium]|nr:winged helix-turn-helix transcriptional regulator [Clostridia bacterium]